MLNTKEHFKQIEMDNIQQEPLFTELTPEAAAAVEGSGRFDDFVSFDASFASQAFAVRPGGSIILTSDTFSAPNNREFFAAVRNIKTGNITPPKKVSVGKDTTTWTGMRGGSYRIVLTDARDGVYVFGDIGVAYS